MPLQRQHIQFNKEFINHYFLCNYQPRYTGNDALSESLLKFKDGEDLHVKAWTECAVSLISEIEFKENLRVIRALGSQETSVSPNSGNALDRLGMLLAETLDCYYNPEFLVKNSVTRSLKILSKTEREVAIQDTYRYIPQSNADQLLIVDDILTTGTTMKEIAGAIRKVDKKCSIVFFTLAITDHFAFLNKDIELSGYSSQWKSREWITVTEEKIDYDSINNLKNKILQNFIG